MNAIQTYPARQLLLEQPTDLLLCDPCYLIEQPALWWNFCQQLCAPGAPQANAGMGVLPTGAPFLYSSTAYGDGCYKPTTLHTDWAGDWAAVDSGLLCLISAADAMRFAAPDCTAFRPDLVMWLHSVQGVVTADGEGRFTCPESGLLIDTSLEVG